VGENLWKKPYTFLCHYSLMHREYNKIIIHKINIVHGKSKRI
jgi:hypothetical protein